MTADAPSPAADPATTKRTHCQVVLQAIIDLADVHRSASRQQIATLTGLKFAAVDECVKRLKNDGLILSMVPGLFEPVPKTPPSRAITITKIPADGRVHIEIADGPDVVLSSHEARALGRMLYGFAQEASSVDSVRALAEQLGRLEARISQMAEPHDRQRRRRTPH